MKKAWMAVFLVMGLLGASAPAEAKMGSGKVSAKSSDVDIQIFGSLKTYPTFLTNSDFNDDATAFDRILDEGGWMDSASVRNEARLGFSGEGPSWRFLMILEADFTYSKANADRGANSTDPKDSGFTGEDFGIEKLEFVYDFGPLALQTGWQTKALDIRTGGLVYGDDHPYIGFTGKFGDASWEALYLTVQDDIDPDDGEMINKWDSDTLDWRVYSGKVNVPVGGLTVSPFYAFSDNEDRRADVHYLGAEAFGTFGNFTPRAEIAYAVGDKDVGDDNRDIGALAAFAALEMKVVPLFNPYLGGYYVQGDDDADDGDINAFNPVTNISRYTSVFGMENAFIYRYIPVLGSHLYSNVPDLLGGAGNGYGGIGNSASANSPGMMSVGVGSKGAHDKWSYKTQFMYYWLEETGALEDVEGIDDIGSDLGWEWDLQLVYQFNKYFSIGNVFALFDPGNAVQDLRGDDFDDTAILDTIELKWSF